MSDAMRFLENIVVEAMKNPAKLTALRKTVDTMAKTEGASKLVADLLHEVRAKNPSMHPQDLVLYAFKECPHLGILNGSVACVKIIDTMLEVNTSEGKSPFGSIPLVAVLRPHIVDVIKSVDHTQIINFTEERLDVFTYMFCQIYGVLPSENGTVFNNYCDLATTLKKEGGKVQIFSTSKDHVRIYVLSIMDRFLLGSTLSVFAYDGKEVDHPWVAAKDGPYSGVALMSHTTLAHTEDVRTVDDFVMESRAFVESDEFPKVPEGARPIVEKEWDFVFECPACGTESPISTYCQVCGNVHRFPVIGE
jgi:hypothetical protein